DLVIKRDACPLVEASFNRKQSAHVNNHERLRDEEKCDCENPEDHVRGAGLDSGSHVVGDDDNEDLSEDEIEQPEFFAERSAVGLNFGLGLMARIIDGRHWV